MDRPAHFGRFQVKIAYANPAGRLLAISDIHGRCDLLEKVLERADLQEGDLLVVVGDVIERGPQSLKSLHKVMQVCESGRAIFLMGNMDAHKLWQIETDTDDVAREMHLWATDPAGSFFAEMCREIGLKYDTVEQLKAAKPLVRSAFARELDFIRSAPTILDTPHWLFVHGGLPDADYVKLSGTEAFACMKFDAFPVRGPRMAKPTVVGHYPVDLYRDAPVRIDPYWCEEKNVLSIDGGCGLREEAQLNCVRLFPGAEFTHFAEDGLPEIIALDGQETRAATAHFRWPHGAATLLEQGEGCALVEQEGTGRRVWVPDNMWRVDDDDPDWISVNNMSDACLAIAPGDRLKLIAQTGCGAYVKKDGVSGWYQGRIQYLG